MIEKLKHKYALSSKGANDMARAFVAVTLSNLVLMLKCVLFCSCGITLYIIILFIKSTIT